MPLFPDEHLTTIDPKLDALRRRTWPGQAHFAGTGPEHTMCHTCEHWTGCGTETGYYSKNGNNHGMIKPRPCEKYRSLMSEIGPAVPYSAAACKYYVAAAEVPPLVERNR